MQGLFSAYKLHEAGTTYREGALAVRCWRHVDGVDED